MSDNGAILLVEDDQVDALLVLRAFEKAGVKNPVRVVADGDEAVSYLEGAGPYANRQIYPMPGLVLLDLKMPKRDGFEVLNWIRSHRELSALPVVVLAAEQEISGVKKAYSAGANSFLVKPMDFENYMSMSHALKAFWLCAAKMPEPPRQGTSPVGK